VSVGISENRLSRKRIACANSEDILVAGKVTRAFFDKTGTLTKQGLDFISAKSHDNWTTESGQFSEELSLGMSACHGLSQSHSGELVGNPVDRTMFQASGATLSRRGSNLSITDRLNKSVEVVKHFDFDHHTMTQSVILKRGDGSLVAYVKGSGESIKKICVKDSLPDKFDAAVRESARSGVYQIAMASKLISSDGVGVDVNSIGREQVESGVSFVGVINFKNVMREETPNVIRHLEQGEVRCVMISGDNVLTATRIARESGIISPDKKVLTCTVVDENGVFLWLDEEDATIALPSLDELKLPSSRYELAVSGEVWGTMLESDPILASQLVEVIRVFGRCTPAHKVSVVTASIELGFITLMCGDGGNDCGALKTAHVGVALSDAEASVVSPFTSLDKSIESVVEVLKEGRCALASALASYKYIIMYGQIESMNQILCAYYRINFSEWCWVFMDGFWVIGMAFVLPLSQAQDKLSASRPTSSLLGPHTMASACGVLFINYFFTVLALAALFNQDWFQCRQWVNSDVSNLNVIGDNYEAQTLFIITGYQYISSAMAYNFGYEFRQSWFQNRWFVILATTFTAIHFFVTLVPTKLSCLWRVNCENENVLFSIVQWRYVPIQNDIHTTLMPANFRYILVTLMIVNAAATMGWDYFVVNGTRKRLGAKKRGQVLQGMKTDTGLSGVI
jgi:predicted P-type ATPase